MATCSMCRKNVNSMEDYIIDNKPICKTCAKKLNDIIESDDRKTVVDAFNYVYTCKKEASDPDVANYLNEILDNNASTVESFDEADEQKRKKAAINFDKQADFFADRNEQKEVENSTPIISMMFAIFAWIIWIGGVIYAFNIFQYYQDGFIRFICAIVVTLVSGSLPMAMSHIIKYLSQIANNTYEIRRYCKSKK